MTVAGPLALGQALTTGRRHQGPKRSTTTEEQPKTGQLKNNQRATSCCSSLTTGAVVPHCFGRLALAFGAAGPATRRRTSSVVMPPPAAAHAVVIRLDVRSKHREPDLVPSPETEIALMDSHQVSHSDRGPGLVMAASSRVARARTRGSCPGAAAPSTPTGLAARRDRRSNDRTGARLAHPHHAVSTVA